MAKQGRCYIIKILGLKAIRTKSKPTEIGGYFRLIIQSEKQEFHLCLHIATHHHLFGFQQSLRPHVSRQSLFY
ncbi:hypothetical protein AQUCO_01400009v1 [Aquilegia coerulea]|uniref:Uncharacterized protein n=1 Tax=Aquilegia coerulea TaxID=218851 RepID=A0A2G5DU05_AQUCA|nr:hypothetical protein AQUCO_01400009v1 [Aquilegia coerulea]